MKIVIILVIISGIALFFITKNVRNEEQAKLERVEYVSSVANKQILSAKEGFEKLQEERRLAQREHDFCRSIGAESNCLEEKRQQRERDRKLCLALGKEQDCLD